MIYCGISMGIVIMYIYFGVNYIDIIAVRNGIKYLFISNVIKNISDIYWFTGTSLYIKLFMFKLAFF